MRIWNAAHAISREIRFAWVNCSSWSFLRYATDVFWYRALRFYRPRSFDSLRTIRLKSGERITYRLNRGDIQTVREVWFYEVYRPPFELPAPGGILLDLGGNIGLTSVYLAKRHSFDRVIVVEPVAQNIELAKLNCSANGIRASFIEAAIGPSSGTAGFLQSEDHNRGRIDNSEGAASVRVVTVNEAIGGTKPIRLVKMDIEGGEDALLTRETSWIDQVQTLIAEFHPSLVDYPALVALLKNRGFRFYPPGSVNTYGTDAFERIT